MAYLIYIVETKLTLLRYHETEAKLLHETEAKLMVSIRFCVLFRFGLAVFRRGHPPV